MAPGGSTTFTLRHTQVTNGGKTATLHLANNAAGSLNPFDLTVNTMPPGLTDPGFVPVNAGLIRCFAVQPDGTIPVGLSLGAWTGSACQVSGIANDAAVQGTVVTGTVTSAAALCVRIYDAAEKVTTTMNYTITVVHP